MIEILIAVRDFLVVLALGWIGVTAEPNRETITAPKRCSSGDAAICESRRPSFNAVADARECG